MSIIKVSLSQTMSCNLQSQYAKIATEPKAVSGVLARAPMQSSTQHNVCNLGWQKGRQQHCFFGLFPMVLSAMRFVFLSVYEEKVGTL